MNLPCVLKSYLLNPSVSRGSLYGASVVVFFVVAVVVAPMLLNRYRRQVVQLMSGVVQSGVSTPGMVQPTLPDELGTAEVALVPHPASSDPIEGLETAGRWRARQLAYTLIKTVLVFAAATVATRMAVDWQAGALSVKTGADPVGWGIWYLLWFLLMLGVFWPIVLLGTATPRFARWFFFVTIPCFLLWLDVSQRNADITFLYRVLLVVFILFMCIGMGHRHTRNIVPTMTLQLCMIGLIASEASNLAGAIFECLGRHLPSAKAMIFIVWWTNAMAGLWCANKMLATLASAYRRKRFSDAQLQMLLWFLLMAVLLLTNAAGDPTAHPILILGGIPVLATAVVYCWLLYRLPAPYRPPVILLLLRVFGKSRHEERLLDRLSLYWRFVGPVCMIAGPDLVKAGVEPHEIAAFLSHKLSGGFITDAASLARSIRDIDLEPDPDTRYRVNEFFCAGEIWVAAARYLIQCCDVVLIDLRQFHAGRLGMATELEMLSDLGVLGKTIAIVGEATDMDAMREAIGKPAAANEPPPVHVLKDVEKFKAYELFAKVVQVARRRAEVGHDLSPPQ
jgi:hypothetical protein